MNDTRTREFHSGLTSQLIVLIVMNVGVDLYLFYLGISTNLRPHSMHRGDVFLLLGLLMVVLFAALMYTRLGHRIVITSQSFSYKKRNDCIEIPWRSLRTFQPGPPNKKFGRRALIGDDQRTIVLESQCFPEYDMIISLITVARKRYFQ